MTGRILGFLAATCVAAGSVAAISSAANSGVSVSGGRLLLNGRTHYFSGVNAYNATSDWHVNNTCGPTVTDLNTVFSGMPRGSLVRTWAFQALGYNKNTHQIDFSAIDRAVQAAADNGDYLILTLSEQAGVCDDGHWHDQAWYDGGYLKTYNDNGLGFSLTMNYLDWVKAVVSRYTTNPTVAIYEPVNEPEASNCDSGYGGHDCYGHTSCPSGATASLRHFFDTVGAAIKNIDAGALVSMGVVGGSQCGIAGTGFDEVAASADVDIATYHDYSSPATTMPATMFARLSETKNLGKPLLVEEAGIDASPAGVGCDTLDQRASDFGAKSAAVKQAGSAGYLLWNWWPTPSSSCALTIAPGDPALSVKY